jgi:uncharacterized iron-regulated membrane protein
VKARFKRTAFLVHRWTGVGMCILMALWFASGMVMLFVGYPKLTPWERLERLPEIAAPCCAAPGAGAWTLTSIGQRPVYLQGAKAVDALTGAATAVGDAAALASARAFLPGAGARYDGVIMEDRWTHSGALNAHRPLHVVEMDDSAATRLYISSATGQVVLDAPRAQRLWNFAGAWLHWVYMLRDRPKDPVWSWTVIILSAIGVVSTVTGILNGLWRWRFNGAYKSGAKSPFRDAVMRWHHMLGLVFGALVFTWMFSGLMSMNPLGMFDAKGARPDAAAFAGSARAVDIGVPAALALLGADGFHAVELEGRTLAGQPYILARDRSNATRLVVASTVLQRWPDAALAAAARRLLPTRIAATSTVTQYDAYYYKRQTQSMYGADERRLPVLKITFDDPGATWVYLDPATGMVVETMDRSQRVGRWLFNFLHSWDVPVLLGAGWLREALFIALGTGGILLSTTAAVLGWRRVRIKLGSTA